MFIYARMETFDMVDNNLKTNSATIVYKTSASI